MKTHSDPSANQIHHHAMSTDRAYFGEPTGSIAVNETGPEHGLESVLQLGDRLEIRPSSALQNALDRRMIDPGDLAGRTEADSVHGGLQVQDESPSDLTAVVVGGHVGPFLRAFAGRGAERPGHDSSVDDTEGASE